VPQLAQHLQNYNVYTVLSIPTSAAGSKPW